MYGQHRREIAAGYRLTTNNRMELLAVIVALKALQKKHIPVRVYTDSQYVVKAVNEGWLDKWIRTSFRGGKKNADLWMEFHALYQDFAITFVWVKGHADNPYNNRCDELAQQAAAGTGLEVDQGYEDSLGR